MTRKSSEIYQAEDWIIGKLTARDIWERDTSRRKDIREAGYKMIGVWESSYKLEGIVEKIGALFDS